PADGDGESAKKPKRRLSLLSRLSEWTAEGETSAWLSSAVVHAAFILLLSLWVFTRPGSGPNLLLTGSIDDAPVDETELDFAATSAGGAETALPAETEPVLGSLDATDATFAATTEAPLLVEPLAAVGEMAFEPFPVMAAPMAMHGGGLDGRRPSNRRGLALAGGGSEASEAAVEAGLEWLAEHQYPDGGWRFDLEACPNCSGYCRNSGVNDSSTAATGLALLSFLGAGYTHQEGKYVEVVKRGVYYLTEQMTITTHGGDLRDMRVKTIRAENSPEGLVAAMSMARNKADTMYAHGIASLALTEAYAMTRDPGLRNPAELAVKFIINGQNHDGGWRYAPSFETPTDSDTTVSGWQVMALKSGVLGGIPVPYEVWMKISQFLDVNATNDGAEYGYVRGQRGTRATSAIGLLCRELEGWPLSHRPLQRGLANLGSQRPQDNHIYYNYYATLALHHAGGSQWDRWNTRMRDYLVKSQFTDGHERGSWYFEEQYSRDGGRLYTTALSVLTLEVYYRYLPLYKHGEDEDDGASEVTSK
ncbi:MAG: terpene cyclase/mutase family protein, partial [Planctomycetales bacterium]|nr:terpene cyclase/mutase family protein [Planctomycetales bacterium]